MRVRFAFICVAAVILGGLPVLASACTLWSAAGVDADGGTLLAKNRDWRPNHRQAVQIVHPDHGFAYVGLYAVSGTDRGIKAGVNEKGLAVVNAATSNLAKALRHPPGSHGVYARLLAGYADTQAVERDAAALFADAHPTFLMIADPHGVLSIEVGPDHHWTITRREAGVLTHTNHFLDPAFAGTDARVSDSSATRLNRVNALLGQAPRPLTLDQFSAISADQHDGPDNSLWRSGREYTLASWIVRLPPDAPPLLRIVVANPAEPQSRREFRLDANFWSNQSPAPLIP